MELREQINQRIEAGDAAGARLLLQDLWRQSPTLSVSGFVADQFDRVEDALLMARARVAILRSFTLEPAVPLFRAAAFVADIHVDVRLGEFNTFAQEILDAHSWLYAWRADVVILAVQTRDLAPALWDRFADLDASAVAAEVDAAAGRIIELVDAFRAQSSAHLLIHALEPTPWPANGLLDGQRLDAQNAAIGRVNARLSEHAARHPNVYLLDLAALIGRVGSAHWYDERKWLTARLPMAANSLAPLADEWARHLHPMVGRTCKVLAVDLDYTLWGGVLGEDHAEGLCLDDSFPGAAYRAVQRVMLNLNRRGILLAICSKNDADEAMRVVRTHPGMLLRPEHFAATRINWADKAANLRELAEELNVGLDAIAFLDDNPVERQWVRERAPQVTVIDLPDDPMNFAEALRAAAVFERLTLTHEDASRTRMYAEQADRARLAGSATSLEAFHRSLLTRVSLTRLDHGALARSAQLTQKTNQFNLTTRRRTEAEIAALVGLAGDKDAHGSNFSGPGHAAGAAEAPAPPAATYRGYVVRVADRFGDSGIVGLMIVHAAEALWEFDTFLLSCRVIGRTVETAMLAALAEEARRAGASRLGGWFNPTEKNAPATGFYAAHGFSRTAGDGAASYWELSLVDHIPACPPWIDLSPPAP